MFHRLENTRHSDNAGTWKTASEPNIESCGITMTLAQNPVELQPREDDVLGWGLRWAETFETHITCFEYICLILEYSTPFDLSLAYFGISCVKIFPCILCLLPDGFACFMPWVADQTDRFQEEYQQWANAQIKRLKEGAPRQSLAAVAWPSAFIMFRWGLLKRFIYHDALQHFTSFYHPVSFQHEPTTQRSHQDVTARKLSETHLPFRCVWNTSRQIRWLSVALFEPLTPFGCSCYMLSAYPKAVEAIRVNRLVKDLRGGPGGFFCAILIHFASHLKTFWIFLRWAETSERSPKSSAK